MKLFDNINDFLNSPVPTMNDIRKGFIKKFPETLPLHIRTNSQYKKEKQEEKQDAIWDVLDITDTLVDDVKDLYTKMYDGSYDDVTYLEARDYMYHYKELIPLLETLVTRPYQDQFYKMIERIVLNAYKGPDDHTLFDIYCDCEDFVQKWREKSEDENYEEENK